MNKKGLECAFAGFPKSIVQEILKEKIKERLKVIVQNGTVVKEIDKHLKKFISPKLENEINKYLKTKRGKETIKDTIEECLYDIEDELKDDIYKLLIPVIRKTLKIK